MGPKYHAPTSAPPAATNYKESPANFQNTQGWQVASPQDAMLRGNWWEIFKDPQLNALEEQLNINNENIKEVLSELHGGAGADCGGARAVLADSDGQPIVESRRNPPAIFSIHRRPIRDRRAR